MGSKQVIENVSWRGTNGVGDFMMALNCCHNHACVNDRKINLHMHWEHNSDFLYHFEDPETIIERMNYIHSFYKFRDSVIINHIFNSKEYYSPPENYNNKYKRRFDFESKMYSDELGGIVPSSDWIFSRYCFKPIIPKKIVIWRPTFNAEPPRRWKRKLTDGDWNVIIDKLKLKNCYVEELTYRTPIREAIYHISNCELIISYDGMWHYIAKNLAKPMLVISEEGITKYHNPNAIRCSHNREKKHNVWWWLNNWDMLLEHSKKKAKFYLNRFYR